MTNADEQQRARATGTIEVKTYNDSAYDEAGNGPVLHRISVTERFHGDIEGEGTVQFLQAIRSDGTASFVGIEKVVGTLAGRSGTFLLQDRGTLEGTTVQGEWFVVQGSGTGDLSGLRGEGGFTAELGQHAHVTLDYWFD